MRMTSGGNAPPCNCSPSSLPPASPFVVEKEPIAKRLTGTWRQSHQRRRQRRASAHATERPDNPRPVTFCRRPGAWGAGVTAHTNPLIVKDSSPLSVVWHHFCLLGSQRPAEGEALGLDGSRERRPAQTGTGQGTYHHRSTVMTQDRDRVPRSSSPHLPGSSWARGTPVSRTSPPPRPSNGTNGASPCAARTPYRPVPRSCIPQLHHAVIGALAVLTMLLGAADVARGHAPPYETPSYVRPPDDGVALATLLEGAGYSPSSNSDWTDIASGNFCGDRRKPCC